MTTLQDALETLKFMKPLAPKRRRQKVASALAGKYKGLLPPGMTSAAYIRHLRDSLYGKFPA